MILSICMIVKNEEKNLRRCLDSLPLIHRNWCELVIVDTGSTDNTMNIAFEYTEKVYQHPWRNSFSEARNHSIRHAVSPWIMIMDADEQLCQESLYKIENLLLSKNAVERPTIFANVRNFYNKECTLYHELLQPRIFLNDGEFRYEGVVHNRPIHKAPYAFCPQITINHYGYLFQVEDGLAERKIINRSLPLLLEQYEKAPRNLHNLLHLVKTYAAIYDADNVIRYGEEWISEMRKIEYHEGWFPHLEGFIGIVYAYLHKGDLTNAERVAHESMRYSVRVSQIWYALGEHYVRAKDYLGAKMYFERVVKIHESAGSVYEMLLTSDMKIVIPNAYNWLASYHYNHGEFELAGEYLNKGIALNENRLELRWDVWNQRASEAGCWNIL